MNRKVVYCTRSGIIGYIRAGYYASRNKPLAITVSAKIDDTDELVAVSPLWAGTIAPAVQTFVGMVHPGRVHLVVTSLRDTFC